MIEITLQLSDDQVAVIAEAIAEAAARRAAELVSTGSVSPWLDVAEAAEWMRCRKGRVYDLVSTRELTPHRDGRRLLFRREDLDAYLERARSTSIVGDGKVGSMRFDVRFEPTSVCGQIVSGGRPVPFS
jgi:excisionase family DNA binding protein